jgi:hypothetical protein
MDLLNEQESDSMVSQNAIPSRKHLGGYNPYVFAEQGVAAGISPFLPERAAFHAGRLMIEEIKRHALHGDNFAFETTLSGKTYTQMIPEWQQKEELLITPHDKENIWKIIN